MTGRIPRTRPTWTACPDCAGQLPSDADGELVCRCGTDDGSGREFWEQRVQLLLVRSGGQCEARTPLCLADPRTGSLERLPRERVSVHHRKPRGMGGTRRADVHALHWLMLICGTGTSGCHGWIESNREVAYDLGLLVHQAQAEPGELTLFSGRVVLLDSAGPFYCDPPGGPRWAEPFGAR